MKEKYVVCLFIIVFFLLSSFVFKEKKETPQEEFTYNFTFPFFKEEKKKEYLEYKEKTGLSLKESIIHVNIGLNHPFYTNAKETVDKGILTIVNKYNFIPNDYIPKNLITVNGLSINKEAYNSYLDMKNDMEKENLYIRIISAYRSYDYQESLYANYLKSNSQNIVDTYSARAGYSEHHTGLAIDIDNTKLNYNKFYLTKEYLWMQDNAYKYGFILRYPKDKDNITGYSFEPWHYRYVGKEVSKYIKEHNITYEEYYYEFVDVN